MPSAERPMRLPRRSGRHSSMSRSKRAAASDSGSCICNHLRPKVLASASLAHRCDRRREMVNRRRARPRQPSGVDWDPADESRVRRTAAALEANGITVLRARTATEAKRHRLGSHPRGVAGALTGRRSRSTLAGITDEIETSGRYEPLRPRICSMDRATQADEIRRLTAAPDVMLGSVHAVTETGSLVAASMSGSQLGPYVSGAGRVILLVGTQKIVPDLDERSSPYRRIRLPARGRPRSGGVWHPQRRQQGARSSTASRHRAASPSSSGRGARLLANA